MAPVFRFTIHSGSKKKEPRCACLSEAKASHSHKMWTEVSSSVSHFTSCKWDYYSAPLHGDVFSGCYVW